MKDQGKENDCGYSSQIEDFIEFYPGFEQNIYYGTKKYMFLMFLFFCTFLKQMKVPVWFNREKKWLRHVAMVANFLDDNKSKRHLKSGFALF